MSVYKFEYMHSGAHRGKKRKLLSQVIVSLLFVWHSSPLKKQHVITSKTSLQPQQDLFLMTFD